MKNPINEPKVLNEKVAIVEDLIGNTYEFDYSKYIYHMKI